MCLRLTHAHSNAKNRHFESAAEWNEGDLMGIQLGGNANAREYFELNSSADLEGDPVLVWGLVVLCCMISGSRDLIIQPSNATQKQKAKDEAKIRSKYSSITASHYRAMLQLDVQLARERYWHPGSPLRTSN